jgi:CO/xanthine dehydrogenase Mo-binding subunit
MTGMIYGAVLRSPHAHARIRRIDTSKAEALPGVKAVVTAADFPESGDRLAESPASAEDAAELVEVDYEPLPVLGDPIAAAAPGAPVLYPAWGDNVAVHFRTGFGDADARRRRTVGIA